LGIVSRNVRCVSSDKKLNEYASQIEPILKASLHKHIGAPMRFVPDVHFFLKELDTPVPYEGKMITHRLTTMSLTLDEANPLREDYWYGHNIPSTLMAATITASPTAMGFPEEPDYFVPIASWKAVSHGGATPENKNAKRDNDDEL
jgi:hypothetical protein